MAYARIKVDLTHEQAKKALAGKSIRLTNDQLGKGPTILSVHPQNLKIIEKAALKGTGCNINLSHGELADTCSNMQGSGFFGDVWNGLKKVWGVLKDSGAASTLADMGANALSGIAPSFSPAIQAGRQLLKTTTGVGIKKRMTKSDRKSLLMGKGLYLS